MLPSIAAGMVPPYVVTAVQGGMTSTDALLWARGEVALALRQYPALCAGGPFGWGRLAGGDYAPKARLAFSYLHFAYDDSSKRVVIQVRDTNGNVLDTIPPSKALDVVSGGDLGL